MLTFEMLMRIFNHDNGGVDHGIKGNGNAAEGHDIKIE